MSVPMRTPLLLSLPVLAAAVTAGPPPARAQVALQTYAVDAGTVTIAGISSGGFMAVQMHVAYSSQIHGAAIFAGGPYYCAQDSESTATGACESGSGLSLQTFLGYTAAEADAGAIDSPSNLAGQPVYLFSGTDDTTVHQATMDVLQQYYESYTAAANVTYNNSTAAAHGWISLDGPNGCDTSTSPYINNCNIDPEETFLTMFYGTLAAKNTGTLGGSFVQFDQTPFCAGGSCSAISMDTSGWLFVPQSCAPGSGAQACRLVVVLHGCLQSQSVVGEDLVKESGVDEWADTNDIVVLYPQAVASDVSPANPEGCWDWWGYTGADYALQSGPQMQTVMAMIDQITGVKVIPDGGSSSGGSSGSSSGSSACVTLGQSCAAGQTCCSPYSCEDGYCLLNLTSSSGGSSSGASAGSSPSEGGSSGGTPASGSSGVTTTGTSSSGGASRTTVTTTVTATTTQTTTGDSSATSTAGSSGCGGCGSAGGPVPLLALFAVAALWRRRPRGG